MPTTLESGRVLYAADELIPPKPDSHYEDLAAEQEAEHKLAQVDYVLGPDEELGCRLWDKSLRNAIRDAERETLKQGDFATPDYAAIVDVTAVPDCEERVFVTHLVVKCGAFENMAGVYLRCTKTEVVKERVLWTFVAEVGE